MKSRSGEDQRRARDLVGRRVELVQTIRTASGDVYPVGAEATVQGFWRGKFNLDMASGGGVRQAERADFRLIEGPRPRVDHSEFSNPADLDIALASYADRAVFVRSLRDWVEEHPGKLRWTLTRDQVQAVLSVLDSVIDE